MIKIKKEPCKQFRYRLVLLRMVSVRAFPDPTPLVKKRTPQGPYRLQEKHQPASDR